MSRPTRVWSLYSEDTGQQYDGLTVAEARAIVMVISHEVRSFWFAYKAGWNSWRPLKDCGVLLTSGGMSRTKVTYAAPDFDVAQFEHPHRVPESSDPEHTQTNSRTSPDSERLIPESAIPSESDKMAKPTNTSEPVDEAGAIVKFETPESKTQEKFNLDGIENVSVEVVKDSSQYEELTRAEREREFTASGAESLELNFETTKTGMPSSVEGGAGSLSSAESTAMTSVELDNESVEIAEVDKDEQAVVENTGGKIIMKPIQEEVREKGAALQIPVEAPSNIDEEVSQVSHVPDNRRTQRYRIKLHAELVVKDKVYQTFTRDVSLGGVAVQGCLPDWVNGYGMIILSTLDMRKRLEFMCSVVENQNGRNFRLELYPSPHSAELQWWLERGLPKSKVG